MRDSKSVTLDRWEVYTRECVLEWTEHQRQRRAELMADIRKEQSLGAVNFGKQLCAAPFILARPHRRKSPGNRDADKIVEAAIVRIERQARGCTGNNRGRWALGGWHDDGNYEPTDWRFFVAATRLIM